MVWCVPTSLVSLYISWPYGDTVCKYIFPMADVIIGTTIFTMVSISIDRYRAIVYPFTAKPTLRKTILVLIFVWTISYVLMGLPLVIATKVSAGYWVKLSCNLEWKSLVHELTYRLISFLCLFCVPFAVVLFCFLRIRNKLKENVNFARTSLRSRLILKRAKKNQKLIKMLFVMFSCFIFCVLPVNILLLMYTFYHKLRLWKYVGIAFQISIALLFSNSIMNPIILYCLSKDYKRAYLQQLTWLCPNSRQLNNAFQIMRNFSSVSLHRLSGNLSILSRFSTYSDTNNIMSDERRNAACQYITNILLMTPLLNNGTTSDSSASRILETRPDGLEQITNPKVIP